MKVLLILLTLIPLISCSNFTADETNLERFYSDAKLKKGHPHRIPLDVSGLSAREGLSFRSDRSPAWEESSIVVTEQSNSSSRRILVYVSPRVDGSFLDPLEPTPQFLNKYQENIFKALQTSQITDIHLLPRRTSSERDAESNR